MPAGSRPTAFATTARPQRDSLNLRFGIEGTPIGRVRLALNSVAMPDSQDPLGLTRAQMEADPEQASPQALQFNTRKTTRQTTLGGEVRTLADAGTGADLRRVGRHAQRRAVPGDSVATQLPPTNPGGVIDFDRGFGGVDLRLGIDHGIFTTSVGVTAEQLDEDRLGYNNFTGAGASQVLGVKGALRRDETNRVESADLYFQTEARLAPAWRLHAGVRTSEIRFESEDHYIVGVNGDDSGSTKFRGTSPTVGAVYKLSDTASLYASYGRGFETPTLNELAYRPDGSAGLNTDLRAAKSDNYEIGAKARFSPNLRGTVALFAVRTKDDIVVRTNAGGRSTFTNVAKTRRQGIEASAEWTIDPRWSFAAAVSALEARFDEGLPDVRAGAVHDPDPAGGRRQPPAGRARADAVPRAAPPVGTRRPRARVPRPGAAVRRRPQHRSRRRLRRGQRLGREDLHPGRHGAARLRARRQPVRSRVRRLGHRQRSEQPLLRAGAWAPSRRAGCTVLGMRNAPAG